MTMCGKCGSTDLIRIHLTPGGRPLCFTTCRACEHRAWNDPVATGAIALGDVLDLVGTR